MRYAILSRRALPVDVAFSHKNDFDLAYFDSREEWHSRIKTLLAGNVSFIPLELTAAPRLIETEELVELDHRGVPIDTGKAYGERSKPRRAPKELASTLDLPIGRDLWLILVKQSLSTVSYHRDRDGEDMPTYKNIAPSWTMYVCDDQNDWINAVTYLKEVDHLMDRDICPVVAKVLKFALQSTVRVA